MANFGFSVAVNMASTAVNGGFHGENWDDFLISSAASYFGSYFASYVGQSVVASISGSISVAAVQPETATEAVIDGSAAPEPAELDPNPYDAPKTESEKPAKPAKPAKPKPKLKPGKKEPPSTDQGSDEDFSIQSDDS